MKSIRVGTLFSGIGAPEQAMPRVYDSYELIFACEFDRFARQSYLANYDIDEAHFHKDINDMDGKQYEGKVDMIIGGSPCQDFSIAGLRAGIDGHRGQLIWQYFRIIDEVRPPVFVYENVKGMVSDKGGKTLKDFLEIFRSIGYHCHAEVLNTKDYGVPQNRERIYIVGFKNPNHYHRFEYAPKVPLEKRLKDVLEGEVDEKYYIDDKKYLNFIQDETRIKKKYVQHDGEVAICQQARQYANWNGDFVTEPSVNVIGKLDMKGNDQIRRVYGTDGIAATLTTMQGGMQEPKIYERAPLRFLDRNGEKTDGDYSFCVDTTNTGGVKEITNHGCRIRKLTPRETLRLQDFSDSFVQVVSDSQLYKQCGNSMSVNVLEMLFRQIEKAQSDEPTNTLLDFIKEA